MTFLPHTSRVLLLPVLFSLHASADLLVQYDFDNDLTNSGTLGGTASFTNYGSGPTPTYTADQGGVSGLAGDFAMDNTSADGMGSAGTGGGSVTQTFGGTAPTLSNFTVSGWYNTATTPGGSARIFRIQAGALEMGLLFDGGFKFQGPGGTAQSATSTDTRYTATDEWVFFAITWDNTDADAVNFYVGDTDTSVSLVGTLPTVSADIADPNLANADIWVGGRQNNGRPFDGLIDDFRIYDSTENLAALESIRIAAIPEPSSLLLLGVALGSLCIARLKRR